jgi:hypothetical protein
MNDYDDDDGWAEYEADQDARQYYHDMWADETFG